MIDIQNLKLNFKNKPSVRKNTELLVLHHSEVKSPHNIKDIHQWHQSKGWDGIGYHYFVSKKGEIFRGRPINSIGAHTFGFNNISTSVCAEGNFNIEKMNEIQRNSIIKLIKAIHMKYPKAKLVMHRDLLSTSSEKNCPGKNFPFDEIKQKIKIS